MHYFSLIFPHLIQTQPFALVRIKPGAMPDTTHAAEVDPSAQTLKSEVQNGNAADQEVRLPANIVTMQCKNCSRAFGNVANAWESFTSGFYLEAYPEIRKTELDLQPEGCFEIRDLIKPLKDWYVDGDAPVHYIVSIRSCCHFPVCFSP